MSSPEASIEDLHGAEESTKARSSDSPGRPDRLAALYADVAPKDEALVTLVVLRDVAILSGLLSLFAAAQTWAVLSGLWLASVVSVVDGLLVGAASAALMHEWGHFVGARLGGGHAPLKPIGGFLPIFDFDYKNNDARAFDRMSIGGNAGDIGVVLFFFFALPMETAGAAALVAGAFGFAVYAAAIEFPVIQKARGGLTAIEALRTIPRDFKKRYSRWGIAAALVAFVLL